MYRGVDTAKKLKYLQCSKALETYEISYFLAEHRYGREEMLALYPIGLVQDTSTSSNSIALLDEDILEAMETTSLLVPDRRALPPLNIMGAVSEEEQRAWSRGANSDTSLR